MKYASLQLAASCVLSVVNAQWLETTIQLSDSSDPQALCYNPTNNKVYCANDNSHNVTVIDGATNAVLATVAADQNGGLLKTGWVYRGSEDGTYTDVSGYDGYDYAPYIKIWYDDGQ